MTKAEVMNMAFRLQHWVDELFFCKNASQYQKGRAAGMSTAIAHAMREWTSTSGMHRWLVEMAHSVHNLARTGSRTRRRRARTGLVGFADIIEAAADEVGVDTFVAEEDDTRLGERFGVCRSVKKQEEAEDFGPEQLAELVKNMNGSEGESTPAPATAGPAARPRKAKQR